MPFERPLGYIELKKEDLINNGYIVDGSDIIYTSCCGQLNPEAYKGTPYKNVLEECDCNITNIAIIPHYHKEIKGVPAPPNGYELINFAPDYKLQDGDCVYTDHWFTINAWVGKVIKDLNKFKQRVKAVAQRPAPKIRFTTDKEYPFGY
jgi:hypothetical protein